MQQQGREPKEYYIIPKTNAVRSPHGVLYTLLPIPYSLPYRTTPICSIGQYTNAAFP